MNYRQDKYGNSLSILGFGCMRFKTVFGKIDFEAAQQQIMTAIQNGVNYFDTAYIYPGSETLLGEVLEKNNIRDKVYIATKLPHYMVKTTEDLDKIFNEELHRLRTDHIDYYFMHMLADIDTWNRLKGLGIVEWIAHKKEIGAIRQVGFSYHGNSDMFCKIVDAFNWDFCMIQYNYMDEHTQAGKTGLQYAHKKGLPVFIMEPLRGGRLANNLPETAKRIFDEHKTKYTPAQWSFKWLWNQPEVTVVLSGMNSVEMVMDNINTASSANIGDLDAEDEDMLDRVIEAINSQLKVVCTGCRYCVPCPRGVDIPGAFAAYNRRFSEGKFSALKDYFICTALRKNSTAASNCIGCGKCEAHCPQGIEIRTQLKAVAKELEGPLYKIALKTAKLIGKF